MHLTGKCPISLPFPAGSCCSDYFCEPQFLTAPHFQGMNSLFIKLTKRQSFFPTILQMPFFQHPRHTPSTRRWNSLVSKSHLPTFLKHLSEPHLRFSSLLHRKGTRFPSTFILKQFVSISEGPFPSETAAARAGSYSGIKCPPAVILKPFSQLDFSFLCYVSSILGAVR